MDADTSFLHLMSRLQGGSDEAARRVVRRFAERLIALAARRLGTGLRRKVDPEDAVQSVFRSFFGRCAAGAFPELLNWDGLWGLLACITTRKCANLRTHYRRARRSADAEVALAADLMADGPTPEEVAILNDLREQATRDLGPRDRQIVELWLLGDDARQIARETDSSVRTVFRTLALVKKRLLRLWEEEPDPLPRPAEEVRCPSPPN
jgi:DNA-directed RNA polymerase specialized sigma24 family protein